jgi:hypothetical protein
MKANEDSYLFSLMEDEIMKNIVISLENVTKPDMLQNALQRGVVTAQVHRKNTHWDYQAIGTAQAKLSLTGFQLYHYLERQLPQVPWCIWPTTVQRDTALTEFTLPSAVLELQKLGYLTPGKIEMNGNTYEENVFHFWETPSLCDIDYSNDAA